ncbi:hypothetical protein C8R44DRAFT_888650 [Mycena epipterygia]|nr:hypothetical protein C8R44DRAFT_888650 [Mycena epipterygia]
MIGPNISETSLTHHLIDDGQSSPDGRALLFSTLAAFAAPSCRSAPLLPATSSNDVAGNVEEEVSAVVVDPFLADLTTVDATSLIQHDASPPRPVPQPPPYNSAKVTS